MRRIVEKVMSAVLFLAVLLSGVQAAHAFVDTDGDGYCPAITVDCPNQETIDCDDTDANVYPGATEICDGKDSNCDGYQAFTDVDNDQDGVPRCAGDCNDADPNIFPGAPEACNGIDDNCDYIIPANERDFDGDGVRACDNPADCNDQDNTVYPGNLEICSDGKDNNCNGQTDEAACSCPDKDNDGAADAICGGSDCNDNDPAIFPAASEICNDGKDNNCDGAVDCEDASCASDTACQSCATADQDNDGYSTLGGTCGAIDCDDADANVYPGATEICDGKDSNCDGYQAFTDVDNDQDGVPRCAGDCNDADPNIFPGAPEACNGIDDNCDYVIPANERDFDGDGVRACDTPADCNDQDNTVYPGNVETCSDGKDNNCNGQTDEAACSCPDKDNDGAVDAICGGSDCDDTDPAIFPANPEICNDGKDNNCDGAADCADIACVLDAACQACLASDADNDGFSTLGGTCGPVDCDDTDADVYPGAAEICDGKDSNCDGYKAPTDVDADGDGVPLCAGDCDDTDPFRSPNNVEICDDGIDNDCDSALDLLDSDCVGSCTTAGTPKDQPHLATLLNLDDTVHADEQILRCGKCHYTDEAGSTVVGGEHHCQRCHVDPSNPTDPLNGVLKAQYPESYPYGFGSAPDAATHGSSVLGTKYGNWEAGCVNCHNPHSQEQNNKYRTNYGKLIKKFVCFDNQATGDHNESFIEFTAATEAGSFADGAPFNENICNTCHTRTNHHQNDGTAPGGQSHNNGLNCTECHPHAKGFKPSCNGCHGAPPASGTHLKHFGGNADLANYGTTETAADFDSADGSQYIFNCGNCHPLNPASHQNSTPNNGGGMAEIELYNPAAPQGSIKAGNTAAFYTPGPALLTDAQGFTYTEGTCDNVYCHSTKAVQTTQEIPLPTLTNGTWPVNYSPPWESLVITSRTYSSPQWGVDTLGCNGCHGNPITTEFPTVSAGAGDSHSWINDRGEADLHTWNMGFGPLQCQTCHHDTVQTDGSFTQDNAGITTFDDMPIYDRTRHVNGKPDISFTPVPVFYATGAGAVHDLNTAAYSPATKTCSNVSCHKNQTEVVWGSPYRYWNTVECDLCHHITVR